MLYYPTSSLFDNAFYAAQDPVPYRCHREMEQRRRLAAQRQAEQRARNEAYRRYLNALQQQQQKQQQQQQQHMPSSINGRYVRAPSPTLDQDCMESDNESVSSNDSTYVDERSPETGMCIDADDCKPTNVAVATIPPLDDTTSDANNNNNSGDAMESDNMESDENNNAPNNPETTYHTPLTIEELYAEGADSILREEAATTLCNFFINLRRKRLLKPLIKIRSSLGLSTLPSERKAWLQSLSEKLTIDEKRRAPVLGAGGANRELAAEEERLMRLLLEVDGVVTGGDKTVRQVRKAIVREVEKRLADIDTAKSEAVKRVCGL